MENGSLLILMVRRIGQSAQTLRSLKNEVSIVLQQNVGYQRSFSQQFFSSEKAVSSMPIHIYHQTTN